MTTPTSAPASVESGANGEPTLEQQINWLSDYIASFDPFMDKHMHEHLTAILRSLREQSQVGCATCGGDPALHGPACRPLSSEDAAALAERLRLSCPPPANKAVADARRIMERACSWFQIQEVAHRGNGDISAKARNIWESMQRWLASPRAPSKDGGDAQDALDARRWRAFEASHYVVSHYVERWGGSRMERVTTAELRAAIDAALSTRDAAGGDV